MGDEGQRQQWCNLRCIWDASELGSGRVWVFCSRELLQICLLTGTSAASSLGNTIGFLEPKSWEGKRMDFKRSQ